jgi:hypothetical protein
MGKSYVGDIGTRIRINVCSDITSASGTWYNVLKPDGTEVEWDCMIEDYTKGIIYYDTISGDFNISGRYKYQGEIVLTNGDRWSAETRMFDVYGAYQ